MEEENNLSAETKKPSKFAKLLNLFKRPKKELDNVAAVDSENTVSKQTATTENAKSEAGAKRQTVLIIAVALNIVLIGSTVYFANLSYKYSEEISKLKDEISLNKRVFEWRD
ncbi:MAG: hypothetical protein LBE20_04600 [Deltaproteobacteria bacterium]|jgi:ATP-dependent phosphoenolpyruvate carboxykinase|nr:hypothetical protein [Deltaproteobacteria bacterium]